MAVLNVDDGGKILSVAPQSSSILGFPAEELEGRPLSDLFPSVERVLSGMDRAHFEVRRVLTVLRRGRGEDLPVRLSVLPETNPGRCLVAVEVLPSHETPRKGDVPAANHGFSLFKAFAEVLSRDPDPETLLAETLDRVCGIMDARIGLILLADDPSGTIQLKAHKGMEPSLAERLRAVSWKGSFVDQVMSSGRAFQVRSDVEEAHLTWRRDTIGTDEEVTAVPILSRGTTLGLLCLIGRGPAHFQSREIETLTCFGTQVGVVLENAGLTRQLRSKTNQIELIQELSGTISSSLSIGSVFRIMVSELRTLVGYDRASLLIYDEDKEDLVIFALDTAMKTELGKGLRAPLQGTSAGWVVRHNEAWINEDLSVKLRFPLDRRLLDEGIRSSVSIPLYQDRMLGVFNLDSRAPGRYNRADLDVLLPAARHIAIALENALLFEAVTKEKREWERTFDAISDMVWIEDFRQKVIRANRALLQRTGLAGTDVAGKKCDELLGRVGIGPTVCVCCDTLASHAPSFREIRGRGDTLFHFWAYPLADDDGKPYAIVHYLKDVTATKRLEQELLRSDKLAALGTLISGIAHEINNPLGIIAGYSEALLSRAENGQLRSLDAFEDFPEYLATIHKEIFRCKEILRSLLEFARPQRATIRELDINEILKEVLLLVTHRAKRLQHRLVETLDREVPKIFAEAGSLRQLFMNILMNAMYFTPEGGEIRIESASDVLNGIPMVRVSISDSGTGIPEEHLGKIFDPFFTTKPVGEGTGLGLSICHRIVKEHDGRIDVSSPPDAGATFTVWLPAKRTA